MSYVLLSLLLHPIFSGSTVTTSSLFFDFWQIDSAGYSSMGTFLLWMFLHTNVTVVTVGTMNSGNPQVPCLFDGWIGTSACICSHKWKCCVLQCSDKISISKYIDTLDKGAPKHLNELLLKQCFVFFFLLLLKLGGYEVLQCFYNSYYHIVIKTWRDMKFYNFFTTHTITFYINTIDRWIGIFMPITRKRFLFMVYNQLIGSFNLFAI